MPPSAPARKARPRIRPWPTWTKSSANLLPAWPTPTTTNCCGWWPANTPLRRSITSSYPNRVLREAGLLAVREEPDGEHLDLEQSQAFAMVDHQFSHVFVADGDQQLAARVADLFRGQPGIAEVLVGTQRGRYNLEHPRSGEVILVSTPRSWQAYYWWPSDDRAPQFARTVDIHRKPGYDPMELYFDPATKSIPLGRRADQRLARRAGRRPLAAERAC